MVETLTESFCERCGTRYEFRAPTRLNPLRKTRGLIGGLKNYLTSQDALSDAVGDAMRSEEDQLAAAQLDAFHETFNFCIGCRQYTCLNCWNDGSGRCRSCAPIAGTDDLTERLLALQPGAAAPAPGPGPAAADMSGPMLAEDEIGRDLGLDSWPSSDPTPATASRTNGDAVHAWPTADEIRTAEEPSFESASEPEPEPEPVTAEMSVGVEPVAAAEADLAPAPLRVVAWESDAAYGVAPVAGVEPEPEPVAAEVESEPEPVAAEVELEPVAAEVEPEPEPVAAEVEPEPVAAEVEPEPEPAPGEPVGTTIGVAPISETILRFPNRTAPQADSAPADEPAAAIAAEADAPERAARRAQLDLLGLGDPGEGPLGPDRPAVLPYRSRGAGPTPRELAMVAGRPGFWEASAREVAGAAAQIGVQNCGECGLSLSATARFCRRCGTRQARSA